MRNIHLFQLLFLLLALGACKKDAEFVPEERPFVREFYVQGTFTDYDNSTKVFDITSGVPVAPPLANLYQNFGSFEVVDGYKHLTSGYYGISSTDPVFEFSFTGQNSVPANTSIVWTKAEIEALLSVNKTFKTGRGPGKVQLLYQVPWPLFPSATVPAISGSSLQDGELAILASEDYQFDAMNLLGETITFTGKKIRCVFTGRLLRPVKIKGPNDYEYEEAQITDGEAVFFVQYK